MVSFLSVAFSYLVPFPLGRNHPLTERNSFFLSVRRALGHLSICCLPLRLNNHLPSSTVPTAPGNSINIFLQDITPANDYFILFINSTSGIMYATSSRFTILAAGTTVPSNASLSVPNKAVPTVTISGTPNPTRAFVTTFPPSQNGVRGVWEDAWSRQLFCLCAALSACLFGAAWTIW
jgi:hypothetical protein